MPPIFLLLKTVKKGKIVANNRIAYGLAKSLGIDTSGMSPMEVWAALDDRGVTDEDIAYCTYNSQESKAKELVRKVNSKQKENTTKTYGELPQKTKEVIKNVEKKARGLKYETCAVIDWNGRILQSAKGNAHEVKMNPYAVLNCSVITHNHPSGLSFSVEDIETFVEGKVYQMRASTDIGKTYVITRTQKYVPSWLIKDYEKSIAFGGEGEERIQELIEQYSEKGLSPAEATLHAACDYREEWLKEREKKYNIKFEVEWDE